MIAILQRILMAPFVTIGAYVQRAMMAVIVATSEKTTYRGIRILLDPCDESNREPIEFTREVLDVLYEREPHRFQRLQRAVGNIMLSAEAGGGLYVPQSRTLVIDLSYLGQYDDEQRDLVHGACASLMLHYATYYKLTRLKVGRDASRIEQIERICRREVGRWFRRWYPEIHDGIDWDGVADETKEHRLYMNSLSFLERFREKKREMQVNPFSEHVTGASEST